MRLPSTSHLRVRLVLMALLTVVPALGVILYTIGAEERRVDGQILEEHLQGLRYAAFQPARAFVTARRLLQTLAEIPAVTDDPQACNALLPKIVRARPGYVSVTVYTARGDVFCSSLSGEDRAGVSDRRWFRRAVDTRTSVVSDYEGAEGVRPPHVIVAHPWPGPGGGVEWVIAAGLELDQLVAGAWTLNLPPGTTLTVFDRNWTVLARYPDSAGRVGKPAAADVRPANPADRRAEIVEAPARNGSRRMYAAVPVEPGIDAGTRLGIVVSRDAIRTGRDHAIRQGLWLLALVSLTTILAALVGSHAFVLRPVRALTNVIARLATGDLTARAVLAGGVPGLNELAASFNTMAEALEARRHERDRAEQYLRESEEHYRVPFEHMPHPSFLFDETTFAIIEVNLAACQHYGYTREEFLRMTLKDIRPPDEVPKLVDSLAQFANHSTTHSTWVHRKKDGTLITVEISSMSVMLSGRRAVIAVVNDVSERKQLEQRLVQAQKMEAVGRLAGGVAHDFNNLLTVILGFGELVLNQLDAAHPVRHGVEEIQRAAESARSLTRQLLAFSRKQVLQPQVLDLNLIVTRMSALLQRVIGEDVRLVARLAPALDRVNADPGQIEQVVMNLAVNARDAMPDGGELTIATANVEIDEDYAASHAGTTAGPHVLLAISDTGVGMDEGVQAHVFEPFFTTKERGRGTGLGLATVYGIVKQSGGSIWVHSQPGHGTSFKIYLPKVTRLVDAEMAPPPAPREIRGTETILLVEDQPAVRAITRRMLTDHGYTVLEAGGGEEALEITRQYAGPVHLLLTDVVMPFMSGPELAKRLPGIRVLYASGYTDDAIVHHQVFEPGVAFVGKPYTVQHLLRKVRDVLDARRTVTA